MKRVDGKVAVISGAARGQGRSHAITLAREGASIVAFDLCEGHVYTTAAPSTEQDLAETARLVEEQGQRCLTRKTDARDLPALEALAEATMAEFGRLDILVINHGVWHHAANSWELEEGSWNESIDTMLTGSWKVAKAFVPKMLQSGGPGSIVITGSASSLSVQPGGIAYSTAKAGLVGLTRTLAWELGRHRIRANMVLPGAVDTPMITTGDTFQRAEANYPEFFTLGRNLLPVEVQPTSSISDAVLWLVSDEAAYVTGALLPIDSGWGTF